MSGVILKYDDRDLQRMVRDVAKRMENKREGLRIMGAIGKESIRTNFAQGGRPTKWKELKNRKGQPLRDTNVLMNSITSAVQSDSLVEIGTNKVYAAVHNFGAKKGSFGTVLATVKSHQRTGKSGKRYTVGQHSRKMLMPWGDIPAREFMVLQQEDKTEMVAVLADFIMEGKA